MQSETTTNPATRKASQDTKGTETPEVSTKRWKLFHYGHPRALFCSRACREGFREDRRQGLIYGPYYLEHLRRFATDAEEYSAITKTCPYCDTRDGSPK